MCHYGNAWCRDRSDAAHECPPKPSDRPAVADDRALTHPAPRTAHAVLNALHLLTLAKDEHRALERHEQVTRAIALLAPVTEDIAALHQDAEAKDARVADLLETGMANALYIERLEQKNTGLNQQLIALNQRLAVAHQEIQDLYCGVAIDVERHTTRFNNIVRLRSLLETPTTIATDSPRTAAGAR